MASEPPRPPEELKSTAKETGESVYTGIFNALFTGIAIAIPIIVTLYLLKVALNFINSALQPVVALLQWLGIIEQFRATPLIQLLLDLGVYRYLVGLLTELITIVLLLGTVLALGALGRNRYGESIINYVDLAIASIPGIGTVYESFRRMSDVMLNDNAENFQEVKLVQCLEEDAYLIGFKTSASPPTMEDATGHEEMVAMFLPLAPNPVTGGLLTYIPESDVYDIDMTIEEGVRSILTSGIATGDDTNQLPEVTVDDLGQIADVDNLQDALSTEEREHSDDGSNKDD